MRQRRAAGRLRSCRGDDHLFEMVVVEGHAPPEAAPEHLTVAEIARTAAGPAAPSELTDELAVRAAFTAVRTRELSRRRHRRGRYPSSGALIARGMSMTAAALLAATGVAAAATGNLPASAQVPLSHSLAGIGISIPESRAARPQQAADAPAETNSTHTGLSAPRTGRPSPTPRPTIAAVTTAPAALSPANSIPPAALASPTDAASGTVTLPQPLPTATSAAPVTTTTATVVDAPPYPVTTSAPAAVTTTTAAPPTTTTAPADPTTTTVPPALGMSTGNAGAGPVTVAPTPVSSRGSASLP